MFLSSINKKHLLPSALAVAVLLTVSGCNETEQTTQASSLPVDVFTVHTMEVPIVSNLTGRVSATRRAEVRPQVSGIIQKRLFVEGSSVREGQQLYQIDPSLYEASVNSAKANVKSAQANQHATKLRADRYRQLLAQKAVSKQDYDDAQAAYLQADAAVKAAEASLATANINLAYTKVYAPISGRISKSNFTEGALVNAQQTSPLTTIQQLDPLYVDLGQTVEDHLALRQAISEGSVKTSDGKATVDIYFSDGKQYKHQGKLEFSDVTVDTTTGMVNVRAIVPNPENTLLPGMFLRGAIHEGMLPNAVVVNQSSVIREAGGLSYVYVIDEHNTAQRTIIKLGTEYQGYYVVATGLKLGDRVISSNLQKIRTGAPVIDSKMLEQGGPQGPQGAAPAAPAASAADDADSGDAFSVDVTTDTNANADTASADTATNAPDNANAEDTASDSTPAEPEAN